MTWMKTTALGGSLALATALMATATAGPTATQTSSRTATCAVALDEEGGCCDAYHACIDSCAEDYAGDTDFCDTTYTAGSAEHTGCMGLADHNHEGCLEDCEPRPPGC